MRRIYIARTIVFVAGLLLPLAFGACNQPQTTGPKTAEPTRSAERAGLTYFEASASGIRAGETVTLRWNVPGAQSVKIENVGSYPGAGGSVVVKPEPDADAQAKYKLSADKGGGQTTNLELTLTVRK